MIALLDHYDKANQQRKMVVFPIWISCTLHSFLCCELRRARTNIVNPDGWTIWSTSCPDVGGQRMILTAQFEFTAWKVTIM